MERASSTAMASSTAIMERASSTAIMERALALQEPRDDIVVPLLLHVTVFLCLAVMLFVGVYRAIIILVKLFRMLFMGVYRAIIILIKLFRKRPERRGRYIWKPMREKEAMDRVNAVLQRKLEEVESGIGRLLEHPPSTYIHDDGLYRTARKIDFIKNLLTAEMNSRSPHRPENLNRMAMRLSILQKAFVEWASPTSRFSKLDETLANWVESVDNDGAVDKCADTSASGSCTKSKVEAMKHEKIRDWKQFKTAEEKGKRKVMEDENEATKHDTLASGSCTKSKVEAMKHEKIRDWKQVKTAEEKGKRKVMEDKKEATKHDTSASGSCTKSKVEATKIRDRKQVKTAEEKGKRKVMEDEKENERNQEEEREGGSRVEAMKDEKIRDRKQEETGEGTVEVNEDEKEGREKKEAEMVSQRKAKVNEDEKVGEKKQEAETVQERKVVAKKDGQERDGNRKEKTVGEVETTEEKARESKDEVIGEKKPGRKRKQQCCGVRSCMAMGCAAIIGFTSALILVALANMAYVEKTVYLVPT